MKFEVRSGDHRRIIEIREPPNGWEATCDGRSVHVDLVRVVGDRYVLQLDDRRLEVELSGETESVRVVVGSEIHAVEVRQHLPFRRRATAARAAETVASPMPGLVVAVHVAAGDTIESDQPLVTLEAMKMQMEIRAPHAGVVRRVHARPGQDVAGGQALVEIAR
ncbi:MAG: biotin/lipoyl-containing protein [Armatimonadota bacterium]|nr:biotin/lipoyl-containing protein [Armatimonadota bacterium]MDR5697068.1 biotin/lipoyl-containing protein [Armatimonadota bacterium]